jgi:subtilisin family serine protease
VTLDAPPLALAHAQSRVLTARARALRLDLRAPASVSYLRALTQAQDALAARIEDAIPAAQIRWRYQVVADGLAVVVPRERLPELSRLPGVARVWPNVTYHSLLDTSPEAIGADQLWGPDLSTAGNGIKIGIVDDGIDQTHPFFNPSGYTMPPGFPKGDSAYTTAKVIVARAFAPPSPKYKYAATPFDPTESDHATHVAGIAAGDYNTISGILGRGPLSGVAPKAYLGNYKVLTIPTPCCGIDGNSPEITAGIEAAVKDGMDVINLSLGEPEISLNRDLVVDAIDAAAQAGVVPAIAAGNDFEDFGRGTISSPGNAPGAISAAAATKGGVIASFSSSGPTPVSLQLKPDVTAPGVQILSSVPKREQSWAQLSGTSMASPHVAGGAALLRQRHPTWTVPQIKSALVLTAGPAYADSSRTIEALTTREGGGFLNLPRADNPLVFAAPATVSFGLVKAGASEARSVELADAGGGGGDWAVAVTPQAAPAGLTVTAPATISVPGRLDLTAAAAADASEGDATGFVVLSRGADTRRIPYWLHVERPQLAPAKSSLVKTGDYPGDTSGKPSRVRSYRYPDAPRGVGIVQTLGGPEQVFEVRVTHPIANFGVAILRQTPGTHVVPRIVMNDDENRLAGIPALPLDVNPYLPWLYRAHLVSGVVAPAPGVYDVVFDSAGPAQAGRFTFRFWTNDTTPPAVRLLTHSIDQNGKLALAVADAGAGVDPAGIVAEIDGNHAAASYASGKLTIPLNARLAAGKHRLQLQVSDYQEEKNMESYGGILPNTRTLTATFAVSG